MYCKKKKKQDKNTQDCFCIKKFCSCSSFKFDSTCFAIWPWTSIIITYAWLSRRRFFLQHLWIVGQRTPYTGLCLHFWLSVIWRSHSKSKL